MNPTGKQLHTYASNQQLTIKGTFGCNVQAGNKIAPAELFVIKGKGIPLIGKYTAMTLGMIKIGINIAAIAETSEVLKQQYPAVFSGVGKLNTKQVSLHIDPSVTPVVRPAVATDAIQPEREGGVEDRITEHRRPSVTPARWQK